MNRAEVIEELNHIRSDLRVLYGFGGTMISYDRCTLEQLRKMRLSLLELAKKLSIDAKKPCPIIERR